MMHGKVSSVKRKDLLLPSVFLKKKKKKKRQSANTVERVVSPVCPFARARTNTN